MVSNFLSYLTMLGKGRHARFAIDIREQRSVQYCTVPVTGLYKQVTGLEGVLLAALS